MTLREKALELNISTNDAILDFLEKKQSICYEKDAKRYSLTEK